MSLGRPISEFGNPTCPKCGTVQESPGSTVCEQCGQDLTLTGLNKPSVRRTASPPKPIPRVGRLDTPLHLVQRVFWTILSLISLIWQLIAFTMRTAMVLLVLGALVVGLSYVPEVRARVPVMKEAPRVAKQLLGRAGVVTIRMLASVASARKESQPETRTSSNRSAPQQRTSHPAAPAQKPAPAKVAASQPLTIKSTPTGATVRLNGLQVGQTPLYLRVAPGTYKLLISRAGYSSVTRTIVVKAGKAVSLNVTLTQRQ